jgi:hypothetical protein
VARVVGIAVVLGALVAPGAAEAKPAKKKKPAVTAKKAKAKAPVARRAVETASPGAVEDVRTRNGAAVWHVARPGRVAAAALVVRAGPWNEDANQATVSSAVARWVVEPSAHTFLQTHGVTLDLEMTPGGPVFLMRGPAERLPAASAHLVRAVMSPSGARLPRAQVRAIQDPRRSDPWEVLGALVRGVCWPGSGYEVPAYGRQEDQAGMVDDRALRAFHRSWYRPSNMTLVTAGPGSPGSFAAAFSGFKGSVLDRRPQSPGQPIVSNLEHTGRPPVTVSGVTMAGLQNPGGALLLRARAAELLAQEERRGTLAGPAWADILWVGTTALVHVVVLHPRVESEHALRMEQAAQLKLVEDLLKAAAQVPDAELNELRKREGSRLERLLASPEGVVRVLAPLSTVVDVPPDLRKAVLATPGPQVREQMAALDAPSGVRFSMRRKTEP